MDKGKITWKELLTPHTEPDFAREVDIYETQLELRKQGKIDETLFNETRLRRGVYGQRYDNGQRHDGIRTTTLNYPSPELRKGPGTLWDAPGMVRIKIPMGKISSTQLETIADLSEEVADGILHATTRQDIQLHYVHIEDTPQLMRRLAAVGVTTREACGNSVRNVTACPIAGVCNDEVFDVTPYAKACAVHLLGHEDMQDFGRKFKISFSGCKDNACALSTMHDLGFVAKTRPGKDGKTERGFECVVGGGLGAVPYPAKTLYEFVPEAEMLPVSQSIGRVFARLGEKKNRARARIKFLIAKLGIEEFKKLVEAERTQLREDPRWTSYLTDVSATFDIASASKTPPATAKSASPATNGSYALWQKTNVQPQRQAGYSVVTVTLPLGDITAAQTRALIDLAKKYTADDFRITVDQNIVMRWIRNADVAAVYNDLQALGLHAAGANSIVDVTACPGTDTCKLGIASSRGLARELRQRLSAKSTDLDEAVRSLHVKVSGCFNSCGQHHIADIGFYGVNRNIDNRTVPHFQVVLGGTMEKNAHAYGLAVAAVPSKRIPDVVNLITENFVKGRNGNESFQDFIKRVGKAKIKEWLTPLTQVPPYHEDKSFYVDWGDPREFTIGDIGTGECAGEVVSSLQFGLADSEREVFEAQLKLDANDAEQAARLSYQAMLTAARALVRLRNQHVTTNADEVVNEFRTRFYDTKLFFDPFAGGKFAHFLFGAHQRHTDQAAKATTLDQARRDVEEAQLFIEASHACHGRMGQTSGAAAA